MEAFPLTNFKPPPGRLPVMSMVQTYYVDKQQTKEAAEKYVQTFRPDYQTPVRYAGFIAGVDYALNMDRWINVEDQLPPVAKESQLFSINVICGSEDYVHEGYYTFDEKTWRDVEGQEMTVTHWQPLPQPPEK